MKQLITFTILLFILCKGYAGNISITFITPQSNQLSGSTLSISVSVVSTYQVTNVTANVSGHQSALVYDNWSGYFTGSLPLTGLAEGITYQLDVVVTDIFNTQQPASINFIYANPPAVNINLPLAYTNAYPSLAVKANCTGPDTSTLRVKIQVGFQTAFDQNFSNAIDTSIRLHPSQSSYAVIYFSATDRWGQVTNTNRTILFDSSIFLSPIYTGHDKIFDFNYNKVIEVDEQYQGKIVDITNANSTVVGNGLPHRIDNEGLTYITPFGVIYGQNQNGHPYDWNNAVLYSIGPGDGSAKKTINSSGQYATWQRVAGPNQTDVYLRNLATQSDQVIATFYEYFEDNSVASNGVVVYRNDQSNLIKYKNGMLIPLTNNDGFTIFNLNPLTDGNYVAYLKRQVMFNEFAIYLHNGVSEILLSDLGAYTAGEGPQPGANYQVNNKFIAYNKPGTSGQLQIWLRDSMGVNTQVTYFNTSSTIEGLSPSGDIVYKNDGKRYYAKKGVVQVPRSLGEAVGRVCYRDSSWYVLEGRYVKKILVNAYVTVANGNWNDPSIWENNMVPPPNADIIILNTVIVNVNTTCNSLHVNPPGSVTVSTGVTFTVLH